MEAKDYMSRREIANLFECLMTGLMYHRPEDYVEYLINCLTKIRAVGVDTVRWDMFLEAKRSKTPLPPISATNGVSREASFQASGRGGSETDLKPSTPLPPIGSAVPEEETAPVVNGVAADSAVPLVLVVGGPGSSKGSFCDALAEHFPEVAHVSTGALLRAHAGLEHQAALESGDLLPDELVVSLLATALSEARAHSKGVLLTGFPRSRAQVGLLEQRLGAVAEVLLVDYEEEDLVFTLERRRAEGGRADDGEAASNRRVAIFKEQTLPVCKHFEDAGKLTLVDGNRSRDLIVGDLVNVLQNHFGPASAVQVKFPAPRPPSVPRPAQKRPSPWDHEAVAEADEEAEEYAGLRIRKLNLKEEDTGRRPGLPSCPVVVLLGGPGSGRTAQAEKICARYEFAHVSVDAADSNIDAVMTRLRDIGADAKGLVLEGFPHSEQSLCDFNREIGGLTLAILIDCFEDQLRQRCEAQGREQSQVDEEIERFKADVLPVVRHLDLQGKLSLVLGDQTVDAVFEEVATAIDAAVQKADTAAESSEAQPEEEAVNGVTAEEEPEAPAEDVATEAPEEVPEEPPSEGAIEEEAVEELEGGAAMEEEAEIEEEAVAVEEEEEEKAAEEELEAPHEEPEGEAAEEAPSAAEAEASEETAAAPTEASTEEPPADAAPAEEAVAEEAPAAEGTEAAADVAPAEEAEAAADAAPAEETEAPVAEETEAPADAAPAAEETEAAADEAPAAEETEAAADAEPAAEETEAAPEETEAPADAAPADEAPAEEAAVENAEAPAEDAAPPAEAGPEEGEKTEEAQDGAKETAAAAEAAEAPCDDQKPEDILKSLKVVFVIGGPGSGKGTQCDKILQNFKVGHVSTGDLMREEVASGSERGQKLKAIMEKGQLVTLDTVLELLKDSLVKKGKDTKCFLVDGFPREKEQGVRFENEVTECAVCLFFDVPDNVMTERLLKRGQTSGRVDDNEETIRARLKTFSDNTDPILEYFQSKGKLAKIDAQGTVDDIYVHVDKALTDAHVERK